MKVVLDANLTISRAFAMLRSEERFAGVRTMNYAKYIVRDKAVCGGQPVIAGTRVPLRTVLASLAEGDTIPEILADFPTLTEEAVRAVIVFAAGAAEEDQPVPVIPAMA